MSRRSLALPGLLVAAIAVAACSPSTPALSDPAEILSRAVETLDGTKSVHVEAAVDGTVSLAIVTGAPGDLALTGTKLTAELDLEDDAAAFELAVPAMLGLTVEAISIGQDTWTRVSLVSDKFQQGTVADAGLPLDAAAFVAGLQAWLAEPGAAPKKLDDASCGSKTCYQVEVAIAAADLPPVLPADLGIDLGSIVLAVLVEKDTLRPAAISTTIGAADLGELRIAIELSRWNEGVDIEPPPASEIE